jgi:hypothetical protein
MKNLSYDEVTQIAKADWSSGDFNEKIEELNRTDMCILMNELIKNNVRQDDYERMKMYDLLAAREDLHFYLKIKGRHRRLTDES